MHLLCVLQAFRLLVSADSSLVLKGCGEDYETPLHRAVKCRCSIDMVQLLIKTGADVKAVTVTGETPLMFSKDVAVTQLLLNAGAAVNARCMLGDTVLHSAAERNVSAGVVCCLLKAGADATATDAAGSTPADVALERRCSTATLLQRAAADQLSKQQHAAVAALPGAPPSFTKCSRGWHRSMHVQFRRAIICELHKNCDVSRAHLQQLEFTLYRDASSLKEYNDLSTLQDRVCAVYKEQSGLFLALKGEDYADVDGNSNGNNSSSSSSSTGSTAVSTDSSSSATAAAAAVATSAMVGDGSSAAYDRASSSNDQHNDSPHSDAITAAADAATGDSATSATTATTARSSSKRKKKAMKRKQPLIATHSADTSSMQSQQQQQQQQQQQEALVQRPPRQIVCRADSMMPKRLQAQVGSVIHIVSAKVNITSYDIYIYVYIYIEEADSLQ
jgi:Ankyrin repeats (many copies)/Mediator complex subunit 3 fungal/Ankyrin repeat